MLRGDYMKLLKEMFNWNIKDILKALIGSFLFCLAINIFVVPNNLYTGGVLGIAQLIRSISIDILNIKTSFDFSGTIYFILNVPLFIVAYKNLGKTFFFRTVFAVAIQTIMLSIIPSQKIVSDVLTNVFVGGILGGIGVGMILSSGASTGGTDIIGLAIAKKYNNFSVGKIGLIVNFVIYAIAGVRYGLEIAIYSIIYSVVDNILVDKMHEQNVCSTAFIFCKKNPKPINDYIKNVLDRDFTYWYSKGGYDDSRTYIIYTALTKYELIKLERALKTFDIQTFMIKSEGIGIKGEFLKKY